MSECLFCRIVKGEIPATVVYEDDEVLAFMDIAPIVEGHALVIPKKHYDPVMEMPDEQVDINIQVLELGCFRVKE